MAGSMTEIPVNGDAVPAYISLPPSGSGPGLVVIQEWWGLVPHIRDIADRFAAQGFVAVAPDLYRGKETTEPDQAGKLVMEMQLEQAAKDMAAAVDALLAMPETTGEGVGVVGFCVGGGLALFLASRKPEVQAVVCYYGFPRQGMSWDLSAVKGAVLGHFAEDDDFAPPELVEQMKQDLLVKMLKRNVYGLAIDKTFLNDVRDVGAFMVKDHEIPKNPPLSQSVDVSVLKAVDAHLVTATP